MIVIDSSAVVAIVFGETEAESFARILAYQRSAMSAANLHETEVVILRSLGAGAVKQVRSMLADYATQIRAFDEQQAHLALHAYEQFGKGRHPARLGLLDCAAYALAKSLDAPLLYKGNDFAQTDIASAVTAG